ncbi:cyclic nucleotide-binding protein [Kalymmatonema gypsitolerans NIES-4073]|nr:cyclic nucleotide-binding protein [Scytonema sp. NIES-4073]
MIENQWSSCTNTRMRLRESIFATQKSIRARGPFSCVLIPDLYMATENRLLAALPRELYEKLAPNLKRVSLELGTILHHPGETIEDLYFPIDCLLSITVTMSDGSTAEAGMVGNREVIGVNAFMGGRETTQTEYIVQMAGSAIKVDAGILLEEFDRNKQLRDVLLRYTQALIAQISQTTGCNSLHVLEQRLARWLLEAQDRVDSDDLKLTQEFLGHMLGVRRAGVTQAAQKFQESGLIRYQRGRVQILDQRRLEATSCECFRVLREEYDRLLGAKDRDG